MAVSDPTGVTIGTPTVLGNVVTAWISGGTAGTTYVVAVKVTTSQGRIAERSAVLAVGQPLNIRHWATPGRQHLR